MTGWTDLDDCVFGHLVWSPPIKLSEDPSKLDAQTYRGNPIYLGLRYTHTNNLWT